MKILINGGCGFLGSNLAAYGIKNGHEITVFDNLSRLGAYDNLQWLKSLGSITFEYGDIRNRNDIEKVIESGKYDAIFHLAGQVAMTTSIANPYKDFEINTIGTLNVLEAVRKFSKNTTVLFSSTNKVYGDLEQFNYSIKGERYVCDEYPLGFDENISLNFSSPYGCSKGAADQYMLDYYKTYGIKTIVFRHSSMYGGRQYATYDQGWIGWFVEKAIEKKENPDVEKFTISGNGMQVRDILHADDMINLYYLAAKNSEKMGGQAFNVGGTVENSLSLLELFKLLEDKLCVKLEYRILPQRASDQKVFIADISKVNDYIQWKPMVDIHLGLERMINWVEEK